MGGCVSSYRDALLCERYRFTYPMSRPPPRTGKCRAGNEERAFPWTQLTNGQMRRSRHEVSKEVVQVELGQTTVMRRIDCNRLC
jgi:hypothetical protein